MKIFSMFIPGSGKKELSGAVETFAVRWDSVHCDAMFPITKSRAQFFTDSEEAKAFKEALKDAAHLLKDSGRNVR